MTELIHYQPGKAFYDSFLGARGNTLAKLAITGEGEQRKSALADLYGLDPSLASQAQAQIGKNDEQDYSELVQSAKVMYSLKGRPEADMMWQRVAPKFSQKYGIQFNPTPQPSDWDAIEQIVRATDGGKAKARSSHILADGTIAYMDEYGNMTRTGEKASNSYGFQTDAEGNVYAQDKRGGTVAPAPMGSVQQGMPQVQAGADPMAGGLDRINQGVAVLKANGVPVDKINAWADSEFAKLQGVVQGGVVEQAPVQAPVGGQARVAVKTDAPKPREAPVGYQFNPDGTLAPIKGGPADPALKAADQAQSLDARKANEQRAALRQDAINFAAAWLGKTPEEVAKMSPQEIREAVAKGGRITAGPIMGSIWGMNKIANPDLEAYKSSAAAKQARINNPTGPVTEGDFRAAEKAVFSADKPARVNADLIYQALTAGSQAQQAQKPAGPKPGDVVKGYRFKGGNPADPKSWEKQ